MHGMGSNMCMNLVQVDYIVLRNNMNGFKF